jgi:hypothetical protein
MKQYSVEYKGPTLGRHDFVVTTRDRSMLDANVDHWPAKVRGRKRARTSCDLCHYACEHVAAVRRYIAKHGLVRGRR